MISKIGFAQDLVEKVLSGEKTITYRLGEKYADNLEINSVVKAIGSANKNHFANIKIIHVSKMKLSEVPLDLPGHDKYESIEDLVSSMQKHYQEKVVSPESIISFVEFEVV